MSNSQFNGFTPPPPTPRSVPSDVVSPTPEPPSFLSPSVNTPTPASRRRHAPFSLPPSSLSSNEVVDFTQPSPAPSVPSDLSLTPNPPSGTGDLLTTENIHLLDGLANPNISAFTRPHPSQLDRSFCEAGCQKFYVVTVGWEVGIFDNW
jgi:hypothetical protein